MYTRCPRCETSYPIEAAQLRVGRGDAYCAACRSVFDALPSLADEAEQAHADPSAILRIPVLGEPEKPAAEEDDGLVSLRAEPRYGPLAEDRLVEPEDLPEFLQDRRKPPPPAGSPLWNLAALAVLGLLAGQAVLYQSARWAQDPVYRPWLDRVCALADCRLPEFRDLASIEVVERGLTQARGGVDGLEFRAVIANYAGRPQRYPDLLLTLTQYDGDPIAQRRFAPADYLAQAPTAPMAVGVPAEARLLIANPGKAVGGFTVELR